MNLNLALNTEILTLPTVVRQTAVRARSQKVQVQILEVRDCRFRTRLPADAHGAHRFNLSRARHITTASFDGAMARPTKVSISSWETSLAVAKAFVFFIML